jgi:hypothetical protein
MSYNWDGLMELLSGKYRPTWEDPCGGSDVKGDMELDSGKYKPMADANNLCEQKEGVMVLDDGKYRPRVVLEHENACCQGVDCEHCGWENITPQIMKLTLAGVTEGNCSEEDPNGEYIIKQDPDWPCYWETPSDDTGAFLVKYWAWGYGIPLHARLSVESKTTGLMYFLSNMNNCTISFVSHLTTTGLCNPDNLWFAAYGGTGVLTSE